MAAIAFGLVVLLHCAWVFSLPQFPSQDAQLHLYYANIFRSLLTHQPGIYADSFYISSHLPPYSLYYYLLIALGSLKGFLWADKCVVALSIAGTAGAVRLLARQVAPESCWEPWLALAVLLDWPLLMGFSNFSMAIAIALFSVWAWLRLPGKGVGAAALFVVLSAATLLTHPVPWLLLIAFVWFDLLLRALLRRRPGVPRLLPAVPAALVVSSGLLYIARFTHNVKADNPIPMHPADLLLGAPGRFAHYFLFQDGVALFSGRSAASLLHRALLLFLLAAAMTLCARGLRALLRQGAPLQYARLLLVAAPLLLLVLIPFGPADINGSHFFTQRLVAVVFVLSVVGASVAPGPRRMAPWLAVVSLAACVLTLVTAEHRLRPIAQEIATLGTAPPPAAVHGMMAREASYHQPAGITFDPVLWSGARYFREHNLLLWNTAWLGTAIIPIKMRTTDTAPVLDSDYQGLLPALNGPPPAGVGFTLVITQPSGTETSPEAGPAECWKSAVYLLCPVAAGK